MVKTAGKRLPNAGASKAPVKGGKTQRAVQGKAPEDKAAAARRTTAAGKARSK